MPELGALIQVGHAGDRQLQELLRQALDPVGRVERVDEGRDLGDEAGVAEQVVDEVVQGALVLLRRAEPVGEDLGFARGLLDVDVRALARQRPGADERLVDVVLHVAIGLAVDPPRVRPAAPALDRLGPQLRHFRQHAQAGADVLAALRVVRAGAVHPLRMLAVPAGDRVVELRRRDAEPARVAADLVEGDVADVAIRGGVLDRLGGGRGRELLEAADELEAVRAVAAGREQARDEIDERLGHVRAARPHPVAQRGEARHVGVGGALGRDVGAVDAGAGDQLADQDRRVAQRVVAQVEIVLAHAVERQRDALGVAGQPVLEDLVAGVLFDLVEVVERAGEAVVERGQRPLALRRRQQPREQRAGLVAGRAVDRPRRQGLALGEDLLDADPLRRRQRPQPAQVGARIGEPVDVIDAQSVDAAVGDPLGDQAVHRVEHRRVLDAHADQAVDVEEAAIGALVAGQPPPGEAVVLRLEQRVQPRPCRR